MDLVATPAIGKTLGRIKGLDKAEVLEKSLSARDRAYYEYEPNSIGVEDR